MRQRRNETDISYYVFKLSWFFQMKWSLIFSLDCQVTPVRKPHALQHNKQPLLKISALKKNYTPHPRAGWSVTLMLKSFWQGREYGRVPGVQIKIKIRKNSAALPALHSPKLETLNSPSQESPLISCIYKPPLTLTSSSEVKDLSQAT